MLLLLLILSAVLGAASPAAAQDTYCTHWNRAAQEPERQHAMMMVNIGRLDGRIVSRTCLLRQVDALVRWANRICMGGSVSTETFVSAFVREAHRRCP